MLEVSAAERCPKPCTDLAQRGEETVRRRLQVEDLITERGSSQSVATEAVNLFLICRVWLALRGSNKCFDAQVDDIAKNGATEIRQPAKEAGLAQ